MEPEKQNEHKGDEKEKDVAYWDRMAYKIRKHTPNRISFTENHNTQMFIEITIISIDGVNYDVGTDYLGCNPEIEVIQKCKNHLERVYNEVMQQIKK